MLHTGQSFKMACDPPIDPSCRPSLSSEISSLNPPPSRIVVLKYNPNRLFSSQLQPGTTSTTTTTTNNNGNHTNGASSPAAAATPARTSTPTPARAPSAAPAAVMPADAAENGAPTRVYINTKVTSHLLEGMKVLAKEK